MPITVTQYKAEARLEQTQEAETPKKSLDIHIYDTVQGDGYNLWTGETIESETSANHIRNVLADNEDADSINIYINSAGGSVYEGLAIYNQLKRHKAFKTVYVDGFACSIASVIAMAGDKVIMPKASMLMIHNAWTVAAGNAKELRKVAEDLDNMSETIAQAYLVKAGDKLSEEKLREMLDNETYIKAEDCLALGLCDSLGEEESIEEKAKSAVQNSVRTALISAQLASSAVNLAPVQEEAPAPEQAPETADPEIKDEPAEPETKETKDEKSAVDTFMNLFTRKAV